MKRSRTFGLADIVCVVRSVGERTSPACIASLREQLGAEPSVIGLPVFRETLRACLQLGIESGKPLLLTCDADVLPYRGAVAELLRLDAQVPANYFQVVCEVDDHLFGQPRNGGLRLYRTEHLALALRELERSDAHRPESGLQRPMAGHGHPSAYGASVLGIHDSQQYHADVFRKAGFFAHKHASSVPDLAARWRAGRAITPDFAVALSGLATGLLSDSPGPDLQSALSATGSQNPSGAPFGELAPLTDEEVAALVAGAPEVLVIDRWVTFPASRGLRARAHEQRRLGQSVVRDLVQRAVASLARRVGE